jgi:hypothetical protein
MKNDAVTCYELTILDESDTIIVTLFSADCHVYFKKGCFICLSCKCADLHCGKEGRRGWRPRHPAELARHRHPAKKILVVKNVGDGVLDIPQNMRDI